MEQPVESVDNPSLMQSDDEIRLREIFEVLNPNSHSPELVGMQQPQEVQTVTANAPFASAQGSNLHQSSSLPVFNLETIPQQPPNPSAANAANVQHKQFVKPFINIIEQPAGKSLRFRYECEGRSAGSIPGVNSTQENKTYPTIEIVGYRGDVVIVVSCVTKDAPYRPHPHKLVGKDGCKDGICSLKLKGEPMRAVFSNLGIQCVKRKEIRSALEMREKMAVDPFKTQFGHKDQPSSIDLNAVRLCFQAFIKTSSGVKSLTPVVTDPIYDKKAMSDLMICRLCSCSAKVAGGDEIILLCEKVAKDDIKVKFFEVNIEGQVIWQDFADFQQTDIHKQTAIAFKTPRYHNTDIVDRAKVLLQLVRPSDGAASEPIPFDYYPDPDQIKRKRLKTSGSPMNILRRELQKYEQLPNLQTQNDFVNIPTTSCTNNFWNTPFLTEIKAEPAMSPQHFGPHRSPYQMSPSPQPMSPMNRNATPSPRLLKTPSAGSQAQMCDIINYNTLNEPINPHSDYNGGATLAAPQYNINQNRNNNNENPFMSHIKTVGESKYVPVTLPNQQINGNGNDNNLNTFPDSNNRGTRMSGGSITQIWPSESNAQFTRQTSFLGMNITTENTMSPHLHYQQPQLHQQQHYQPQQQFEQLPNDIGILANMSSTEECPTLSGLLAMVDSDQLMAINSDDLPLSNLSIST